jgi:branched-chain amino acid aminotransferase
MKKIWLNHKLVPESQAMISVLDRGFLYGDGVYEAVRTYQGKIFRADHHWNRLDQSLQSIRLKIPWSHDFLTHACLATIQANGLHNALVRITISRGIGEVVGYDPFSCKQPTLTLIAMPVRKDLHQLWEKGVKIKIVNVRRNSIKSLSPAIKHTNALNGILAKMEAIDSKAFEGVFLNLEGYVAEGTISNICLVKKGVLKTPSLDCGILDGVTRHAVLELARKAKIKVLETKIKPSELYQADEVFLTSTTMETMPVVQVNNKKIGRGKPGPMTCFLHAQLRELIQKELNMPIL